MYPTLHESARISRGMTLNEQKKTVFVSNFKKVESFFLLTLQEVVTETCIE
jgi:hypothetical protein